MSVDYCVTRLPRHQSGNSGVIVVWCRSPWWQCCWWWWWQRWRPSPISFTVMYTFTIPCRRVSRLAFHYLYHSSLTIAMMVPSVHPTKQYYTQAQVKPIDAVVLVALQPTRLSYLCCCCCWWYSHFYQFFSPDFFYLVYQFCIKTI